MLKDDILKGTHGKTEKKRKIVIIGAGSQSFGLSTLVGLLRHKDLDGMEMVLVDIAEEKLRLIGKLAVTLKKAWGSGIKIETDTDYRKAVKGASYIVISVAVDRMEAWDKDIKTALKYGKGNDISPMEGESLIPAFADASWEKVGSSLGNIFYLTEIYYPNTKKR